ncbi:TadE/TadG family type IV pilus assembly protein [Stappia sp. BW2]|uniref:TadE/TadG family type IV pilus assembly protein n=1 Tax=Stappia sp. BW2 TaxID=2592622 RepID=UPI001AD8CB4B|nr:TadE/TadG family type IV pilus assembly protein [Stappia sp. BW2]
MQYFRRLIGRPLLTELAGDRKASILPVFGIMVILIVVIAGISIDVSRTVNAREKLSFAIDAAALSVAADLSTSVMSDKQITDALADSFKANLAGVEFLDEAVKNLDFVVDPENGTIKVSSFATLDNYFIDMGGYGKKALGPETFSFGTSSQVTYSRFDVELALVVDVTGSMRNDMQTLRDASEGLVNILIPEETKETDSKVRISLIPYSQGVNLGSYAEKVKGGVWGYGDGSVCVTERQDYDDGEDIYKVRYTDKPYNYYVKTNPPPQDVFYGGGSNKCSSTSKMIPLTSERDTLLDAIAALDDNGGTAGQTGVVWGWNSISPNYSDVWPLASKPEPYDNDDVLKFAIIMTDGDNNRYYEFVKEQEECDWVYSRRYGWQWTCEMVPINRWLERSEGESYNNNSSKAQRALCQNMKDEGISIFGVYFGSKDTSAGSKNMQSCASPGNYYKATSSDELINAFANIAKKIQQIYVSR